MGELKTEVNESSQSKALKIIKSPYFIFLLPLPFILWAIGINLFHSSFSVFPLHHDFSVSYHTDGIIPDDSTQKQNISFVNSFKQTDSSLSITYQLGTAIDYPYAGILIKTYIDSTDSTMLNISKMDYLEIDLALSGGQQEANLYFSEFIDGYTSMNKSMSWRTYEYQLHGETTIKRYRINLKEFQTNPWWFKQQGVSHSSIPNGFRKKVLNFVVENGNYETKGVPLTVTVKDIRFGRDLSELNTLTLILSLIYLVAAFFIKKFGFRKVMGPVVIPYRQLDITSYLDDDTKKIENYVAINYCNPDLCVKNLCDDTGITNTKVQVILKKQFQLTFRQYLNKIKIHEAKRLLQETDRQVTEIAYRVGYKNVTHFNRIFKEMEGISPIQFRKSK